MNHDEIIQKVQKLLALATSPNENEAKLAAAKAHELLTKYNLSIEAVDQAKLSEEYESLDRDLGKGAMPPEDKYIFALLQKYFYVKVLSHRFYAQKNPAFPFAGYKRRYKFTLVGRKHNTQIARFVYDFLSRSFKTAFADLCKRHGCPVKGQSAKSRRSYYHGLYLGLRDQLEESVQKALAKEQQVALREDPNIAEFMKQQFGDVQQAKERKTDVNQQVLAAGYKDGQQMRIAVGITGPTDDQKQVGQVLALEDKS